MEMNFCLKVTYSSCVRLQKRKAVRKKGQMTNTARRAERKAVFRALGYSERLALM